MKISLFISLFSMILLAFSFPPKNGVTSEFPEIENITSLKVRIDSREIKVVTDERTLREFSEFLKKESKDWDQPWYGIPGARLKVDIYSGEKFAGHFGIGSGCFATHREGDFFSKSTTKSKAVSFLKLLDLNNTDEELMMKFIEDAKWAAEKTDEQ